MPISMRSVHDSDNKMKNELNLIETDRKNKE